MASQVLVAYGSRYGATAEIAARIGEALREAGLQAEVRAARDVADLAPYGAVVLGSGIYAGQWHKDAARLLKRNAEALAGRPVWLFSSGPTGPGDPSELLQGWRLPEGLKGVAERVQPRDIALFGGAIDAGKLNFIERLLVIRLIKAPVGDFRDWDAIMAWAGTIAAALHAEAA